MPKTAYSQQELLGQIKDIVSRFDRLADPFLFFLPALFERHLLKVTSYASFSTLVQQAARPQRPQLLRNALLILNQLVDPEDGTLIEPNPLMFRDNSSFKWVELGNHHDVQSTILHIVNKVALVLDLEKQ